MTSTGESTTRIRDRLLMTAFVAALVHGLVILGLTFGAPAPQGGGAQGLDVLLTSEELPAAPRNDSAAYLAQRTQLGAGNTDVRGPLRNRAAAPGGSGLAGRADGSPAGDAPEDGDAGDARVIATRATDPDVLYFSDGADGQAAGRARQDTPAGPGEVIDDTGPVQLRGPRRNAALAPDSRQYAYAAYLVRWTRRVERVGTLNFPVAARHAGITASPVIQMVIGADGRLRSTRVQRSSGYPDLDQAALSILKLASPFDPFPPDMARRTRTLGFAYEFRFTGSGPATGQAQAQPDG